jgi:hypothetical protein
VTQFAIWKALLLAERGDMAGAATRIAGNIIDLPKNGFRLDGGLRKWRI